MYCLWRMLIWVHISLQSYKVHCAALPDEIVEGPWNIRVLRFAESGTHSTISLHT